MQAGPVVVEEVVVAQAGSVRWICTGGPQGQCGPGRCLADAGGPHMLELQSSLVGMG